ncbi:uncharacterized protein B0I36DRAFT_364800 [Microdochium trichocladiopsis]|uniref:DUF7707 domain-containing protein n=1 Tax=Microdochium trichocladiopsis TaxID=1682393 RepID=A0A9P8Y4S9_9PEZI|nr:uncharacterized protein B0I36DRAFT_364800 [Microdochium trichocladiopsis]KAH7027620.1 hypothetical protein B0I36DRAFT_364800 [Microdochium trichocladiopsis]
MPSLRSSVLALATIVASVARADYYIDPDSVALSIRTSWCQSELSTCPIICQQYPPGTTLVNTCDPEHLTYGCLCGNGQKPNVTEYTLTLPYFTCTEWGNQCVKACGQDNECSRNCREDHPCGALSPTKQNETATSSSASATASATQSNQVFDGLNGATPTPGGGNSGAAGRMLESGSTVMFAVLLGGVALGAGLL